MGNAAKWKRFSVVSFSPVKRNHLSNQGLKAAWVGDHEEVEVLLLEKEGRGGANNVFDGRTSAAHLCIVVSRITVWLDSLTLNELSSSNSLCSAEVLTLSSFLAGLFRDPCRNVMSWNISLRVAEICQLKFVRVHFSSGTPTNSKLPHRRCLWSQRIKRKCLGGKKSLKRSSGELASP